MSPGGPADVPAVWCGSGAGASAGYGGGWGVPRCRGARVYTRCAHYTRWDECIYGAPSRPG